MNAAASPEEVDFMRVTMTRKHAPQPVEALHDRFQHFTTDEARKQHMEHIEKHKHLTPF